MSKPSRKLRDKWRLKEWYSIFTPSYFGATSVAVIPTDSAQKLVGKVVETTLYDITNDFSHQSVKLYFLVVSVNDGQAQTILKGHEYSTDYLRSLVRRGSNRLDGIFAASSKDRYTVRVYVVAFTHDRIKSSQEKGIREIMRRICVEKASTLDYSQLCHEIVLGKLGSDIYNEAKKIAPLRHVGVRKSKLLTMPMSEPSSQPEVGKEPVTRGG